MYTSGKFSQFLLSLLVCGCFCLQGPVRFGAGVVVKGDVTLECSESSPVTIQSVTYEGGSHKVAAPAEEPASAGAPAMQPAFA